VKNQLSKTEKEFVDFALLWHPFGGPKSEEVFVRFGMPVQRFRCKVSGILASRSSDSDEVAAYKVEVRERLQFEIDKFYIEPCGGCRV